MARLRFSFSDTLKQLKAAVIRFSGAVIAILILAVLLSINIYNPKAIPESYIFINMLFINILVFVRLMEDNKPPKWVSLGVRIAFILMLVFFINKLPDKLQPADVVQQVMINLAFILGISGAHHINKSDSKPWWQYAYTLFVNLITTLIFASILMGGLSLVLVSLDRLFNINIPSNSYSYLAVFCYTLFAPLYFLAKIPEKGSYEDYKTFPGVFKILGLYILLPILTIYLGILYLYLLKIIFTWTLPVGWVSWLVSILGLGAFLTMAVLYPIYRNSDNKTTNLFFKLFPMLILPLLALMLVGIIRRFSDYGITINRLLVLILNLWLWGASLFLIFNKNKQLKWLPLSLGLVALLAGFGPWSVVSISKYKLEKEFVQLLLTAGWQNSTESEIKTLSEEQQVRLLDVGNYMQNMYGVESVRPFFSSLGENAKMTHLSEKLEISERIARKNNYFSFYSNNKGFEVDLKEYKQAVSFQKKYRKNLIYKSDNFEIKLKMSDLYVQQAENEFIISLKPVIDELLQNSDIRTDSENLIIDGANYTLFIIQMNGELTENGPEINTLQGILFLK